MTANKNCIIRLSRYKNALNRLKNLGVSKVFSKYLGEIIGVSAAQVRKDFSIFGLCGNKRGGYRIDSLVEKLNTILGKNEVQKVILVGAGHLGAALLNYKGFAKEGIEIVACFDIDPSKHGKSRGIPVMALEELSRVVREQDIKLGIVGVPDMAAQQVLDLMVSAGIRGILNFAPISLKHSTDIVVNNVSLELELENVIYFVNSLAPCESVPA